MDGATLIIIGDLIRGVDYEIGAELWRVPFLGWGEYHHLVAVAVCSPRRNTVVDEAGLLSEGDSDDPILLPSEVFTIQVEETPRS